jgi:hypothetical protein
MPCYTVRKTPVVFEKVAYKPAHLMLLMDAVKELGYQVLADRTALKIWPAGAEADTANTILYQGGRFEIPSPLKDRFTLDRVKQAYARQAVKVQARRNGWLLRELSQTEFEVIRRG